MHIVLTLLVFGMLLMPIGPSFAQGIRKIVDANGVTYFTNEPPERDPAVKPSPVASAAVAANSVASATSQVQAKKPEGNPNPPQSTTSQPAKLPINPSQALGDWPPKSLKLAPATVP